MELQRSFANYLQGLSNDDLLDVARSCCDISNNNIEDKPSSSIVDLIVLQANKLSWDYMLNQVQETSLVKTIEELGLNIDHQNKSVIVEKMTKLFTGSMKNILWNFSFELVEAYCEDLGIRDRVNHDILYREWALGGFEAIFSSIKAKKLRELLKDSSIEIVPKNEKKKEKLVYFLVKAIVSDEFVHVKCPGSVTPVKSALPKMPAATPRTRRAAALRAVQHEKSLKLPLQMNYTSCDENDEDSSNLKTYTQQRAAFESNQNLSDNMSFLTV